MFSTDNETEKKKKEEEKKKKIDEMLEEYDKNKKEQLKKDKNDSENELSFPKVSYSNQWVKNDHADTFLKCISPALAIVGVGCVFWAAGFAVNELSKAAYFLKDISLPKYITHMIGTAAFWEVAGIVAAIGVCIFLFLTAFSAIKNNLNEGNRKKINNKENKYISNQIHKNHSIEHKNKTVSSSYEAGNAYNQSSKKRQNIKVDIAKTNIDKQDVFGTDNKKNNNFNTATYDKNTYRKNKAKAEEINN